MSLVKQIQDDMVSCMKSKDSFTLGVIRMVKGAMQLEAINKRAELDDADVISVIQKQIKMRNDSILEFEKAGRVDLVEQNKKEIEVLKKYMPKQLSDSELNDIIDDVFKLVNPSSTKDIGLIMKELTPRVKGQADMSKVSLIVKEKLTNM